MLSNRERQKWREDVHRLKGLPLLPCGGGDSGKAPLIRNWPTANCSPEEVLGTVGLRSVGIRLGPDAGGLVCIDFDGQSAIDHAASHGHAARTFTSWVIGRDSDPDRFKVVYRVDAADWETLPGKTVHSTGAGEQVEVFFRSGQVIVLGEHVKSGSQYRWLHGGPESIEPLPQELAEMWFAAIASSPKTAKTRGDGEWRDCVPCPICGRPEPDCRISSDRRTIACHRGARWSPPILRPGATINRDGVKWAYVGETQTAVGAAALFVVDTTQPTLRRKPEVPTSEALRLMAQELGDVPRLNVRTRAIHVGDREFSNTEAANLYLLLSQKGDFTWTKQVALDAFVTLGSRNEFDPVKDYLDGLSSVPPLPMEQWNRLDRLLFGLEEEDEITARFFKRFLVSPVQRIFEPGCPQRQMPVLVGPQDIGKSSLGAAIFGIDYYGDGVTPKLDVDSVTALALCWWGTCRTRRPNSEGTERRAESLHLQAIRLSQAQIRQRI